jgi:hypothetical protein
MADHGYSVTYKPFMSSVIMSNAVYVDSRGATAVAHYFIKYFSLLELFLRRKKIDQRWNLFSPKTGNPY